ncbi:ESX-1 secretion-associated protein [Mycobacterium kyorinense]|uniref:ESX-1 secretion-associated protein n=1 Tax=Mycobacterium kyorinense TaxID=487514 RepID=A0A1X1XS99_9MYCO|nr:ESX-1 secretion-associated protein [Mycobacterium kyorinense]ORW01718.1 hypothetical protein AWC14_07845 [Mycobacterium kyorinense]
MSERIRVVPAQLRAAAEHHQQMSDYLRSIPSSHPAIQDSLDSLGPIFCELREAGRDLLDQRRQCYEQQADDHADIAHTLRTAANMWEQHEDDAAHNLGNVGDDAR